MKQKMGLPPAHKKALSIVRGPEMRRRLSQIFCGLIEQD